MKKYLGVKIVDAESMDSEEAERTLCREIDTKGEIRPGYLVTYEDGYESWSPKDVFEKAYKEVGVVADQKEQIGILVNPGDGIWDIVGHTAKIKIPENKDNIVEELFTIVQNLEEATKYGLQYEVVHASLKAMKENPGLSIDAAIVTGYNEWVK